ncbi:hypothetical protein H3N91_000238 [Salmonella enterica]|nr:hypothetical protein [Salmonella enterica]EEA2271421.1 hypothetical protein [Salmonella enterica]EFV5114826.1 hypothetical protein [Salmonella enterica]EGB7057526.1 hypothetical protein [Salmonella enterica]EKL9523982.1 hypothetical protein [Salmonella enterica]
MTSTHFHGSPIWGMRGEVHRIAVTGSGAFVSFIRPDQMDASLKWADLVGVDCGAFSAWRRKITINWLDYYHWLERYYEHDKLAFFVIPDVVEGGEVDNDKLIGQLPQEFRAKAVPVWHLHESIERLIALCYEWPRVAFGSSGEFSTIRTKAWHSRMIQAFDAIYCQRDLKTRIHGLRMLDGRVLGAYPLDTADSTNLACNVPKYEVKYPELTRQIREADYCKGLTEEEIKALVLKGRCAILKNAIESVTPPLRSDWVSIRMQVAA